MVADVVARYHRLRGDDTFFLTGVDEHAAKVSDMAAEHGVTPQEWADQNAEEFRGTFEKLEMTNDDFVRTSSQHHEAKVSEYIGALLNSGDVYPGEYEGWYDAGQEEYIPENKAKELDYKSPVNGKPLVRRKEKNYFFRLSNYRDALLEHFEKHPDFVQPEARKNEVLNRIREAEDVPISRTGSGGWGIEVPGDPEQTIWVWFDALFNYLTYADRDGRRHYWQSGATHFIAKDILWFHGGIWPALLLALRKCPGYDDWHGHGPLALPRQIYAHSYWVSETGQKMSKSLGNFLDPKAIDNYVDEFGLDALRYFLATRGPLGTTDSAFSPDLFIETYNADLANTFGNSASRVTNMIGKYFGGVLPEADNDFDKDFGIFHLSDGDRLLEWKKAVREIDLLQIRNEWQQINLAFTADEACNAVQSVDSYIEQTRPFTLAKDPEKMPEVGTILYNCAEALRIASVLLWPFIPDACERFWSRIGCSHYAETLKDGGRGQLEEWVKWGQLEPGTPIEKGEALFPRYQVPKK
jgi:methionyl-tRNA synthetase